ncbi:molybdate ABC transporter substrate-binding protein [Bradyrhizobium sp. LLZ17]|uniref:Molybdate ABC transporter substrate-binding protein n=1 Tax=Bradyrhizobium sp. LLZ17 TaxID=3239388 RepID=A0AB39XLE9_9BRAD
MDTVNILSGGAAQGLVRGLTEAFRAQTGFAIDGEFSAVGAMADKLRAGEPADLMILTQALIARLAEEKLVVAASIANVGRVETALAVRSNDPRLTVRTESDLRDVLRAADAIFVPDIKASTAGRHVARVLDQLGIAYELASRLKIFSTAQPRCGSWRHPLRKGRSAARKQPKSSPPRASHCWGRCRPDTNSSRCTRPG